MDDDGMLVINARLAAEQGAGFINAMQAMMEQLFRRHQSKHEVAGADQVADREKRNPVGGGRIPDNPVVKSGVSAETFPQKRADALSMLSEQALYSLEREGVKPVSDGDRYQVMVHVEREDALLSGDRADSVTGIYYGHDTQIKCSCFNVSSPSQR